VVKAVSAALGIERDRVTSPSFTLINRYPGTPPVVHMDTYRLEGAGDFEMLDPEYYWTNADAVVFIEWAEKVRASLPKRIYWLKIDILDASTRRFRLEFPPGVNSRAAGRTGEGGP
jgi:tRNA threonylcarbamoyladenosine biosynthesis protein TsaE